MIEMRVGVRRFGVVVLVLCSVLFAVVSVAAQPPNLPPGVRLLEAPPGAAKMPQSIEVYSMEVDWTHPFLRARIELGLVPGDDTPKPWEKLAPDAFKLQLVEPVYTDDQWSLALDAELPGPEPRGPAAQGTIIDPPVRMAAGMGEDWPDQVRVGGVVGWAPHGARAMREINSPPPVLDGSGRANVRWLGRPSEWAIAPPDFDLASNWMVSTFDPMTGRGEFHLIVNRSGRAVPPRDLEDWIKSAWPQRHIWLAIHSTGPMVMAGIGNWRLGDSDTSRAPTTGKIERLGAVLVLEGVKAGDWVDWARLGLVGLQTSPSAPDQSPENATRGPVWPTPLRPMAWVGSNEGKDIEIEPYFEVSLPEPRPIEQVRILHASAAGWSRHFDARALSVDFIAKDGPIFAEPVRVTEVKDSDTVIQLGETRPVAAVRIKFQKLSGMDHPRSPARLAGVQLWGPWDGVTEFELKPGSKR